MKLIKLAVLTLSLAAFTACGGGSKKDETTPETKSPETETKAPDTNNETKTPDTNTTAAKEPTCENAVAHGMSLMVKSGMATQEQVDKMKDQAVAKCKSENPPKEALACVLKATTPQELQGCDPKKGRYPHPKNSTRTAKRNSRCHTCNIACAYRT